MPDETVPDNAAAGDGKKDETFVGIRPDDLAAALAAGAASPKKTMHVELANKPAEATPAATAPVTIPTPTAAPAAVAPPPGTGQKMRINYSYRPEVTAVPAAATKSSGPDGSENLPELVWMFMRVEDQVANTGLKARFKKFSTVPVTICVQADKQRNGSWTIKQLGDDGKGGYTKLRLDMGTWTTAEMVNSMQGLWEVNAHLIPPEEAENPSVFGNWAAAYRAALTPQTAAPPVEAAPVPPA